MLRVKFIRFGYAVFIALSLMACNSSSEGEKQEASAEWTSMSAEKAFRAPQGWINDWDDLLSSAEEDTLRALVHAHEAKTSNQVVYIISSEINGYSDFSEWVLDIGNDWGVGDADKDNGLIIALNNNLQKIRINTGLGLEEILPDSTVQRVIDNDMLPFFQNGEYYNGLRNGGLVLMDKLEKAQSK